MSTGRALVTGGAGFVGVNLADRLLREGQPVVVLDNLSRPGVRENLRWLRAQHGERLRFIEGDVRDAAVVRQALRGVEQVFHFAAQVAVTTSLEAPRHDYEVNLGGTFTLLEEIRRCAQPPALLFTSTNKVYGALSGVPVVQRGGRYEPTVEPYARYGVSEEQGLSFCSPYGCSKGGADQYVVDYAKSYGLPTAVFRMSCIYGVHQQGNEDQGWVAHFVRQALADEAITIYGDGCQVRDLLYVEDLVNAMQCAMDNIRLISGCAFNIGGGPARAVSLLDVLDMIGGLLGRQPECVFGDWRVGDQRWYVSDTRAFTAATGWTARVGVAEGLGRLTEWLSRNDVRQLTAVEAS